MSINEARIVVLRKADELIEKVLGLLEPYAEAGDAVANEVFTKLLASRHTLELELTARVVVANTLEKVGRSPCGMCGRTTGHDIVLHASSRVSVYRDPAEKNAEAWRVRVTVKGNDSRICTPMFTSRGAAYAYAGAIKDGQRAPEW